MSSEQLLMAQLDHGPFSFSVCTPCNEEEATCWYSTPGCITGRIRQTFIGLCLPQHEPCNEHCAGASSVKFSQLEVKKHFLWLMKRRVVGNHIACSVLVGNVSTDPSLVLINLNCLWCEGKTAITATNCEMFLLLMQLSDKQFRFQMMGMVMRVSIPFVISESFFFFYKSCFLQTTEHFIYFSMLHVTVSAISSICYFDFFSLFILVVTLIAGIWWMIHSFLFIFYFPPKQQRFVYFDNLVKTKWLKLLRIHATNHVWNVYDYILNIEMNRQHF